MKGLSNYLCLRRLEQQTRQASFVPTPELDRIVAWMAQTTTGDRADLTELPDARRCGARFRRRGDPPGLALPLLRALLRHGMPTACAGRAAGHRQSPLFFADLALRSAWPEAQVLPPYEVVNLRRGAPDRGDATEFFGMHVSTQRCVRVARDLERAYGLDGARAHRRPARLLGAAHALGDAVAITCRCRAGADEVACRPEGMWAARGRALPRAGRRARRGRDLAEFGWARRARGAQRRRAAAWAGARPCYATRWARWSIRGPARQVRWVAATRATSAAASPIDVGPALARASSR